MPELTKKYEELTVQMDALKVQILAQQRTIIEGNLEAIAIAKGPEEYNRTKKELDKWFEAHTDLLEDDRFFSVSPDEYETDLQCVFCEETARRMVYCTGNKDSELDGCHIVCYQCAADLDADPDKQRCPGDHTKDEDAVVGPTYPYFALPSSEDVNRLRRGVVRCTDCKSFYKVLRFAGHDCSAKNKNTPNSTNAASQTMELHDAQEIERLADLLRDCTEERDDHLKAKREYEQLLKSCQALNDDMKKQKLESDRALEREKERAKDVEEEYKKQLKGLSDHIAERKTYSDTIKKMRDEAQAELKTLKDKWVANAMAQDNPTVNNSSEEYQRGRRDRTQELGDLIKSVKDTRATQAAEMDAVKIQAEFNVGESTDHQKRTLNLSRLMRLHTNASGGRIVLPLQPLEPYMTSHRTDNAMTIVHPDAKCGENAARTGCARLNHIGPNANLAQL